MQKRVHIFKISMTTRNSGGLYLDTIIIEMKKIAVGIRKKNPMQIFSQGNILGYANYTLSVLIFKFLQRAIWASCWVVAKTGLPIELTECFFRVLCLAHARWNEKQSFGSCKCVLLYVFLYTVFLPVVFAYFGRLCAMEFLSRVLGPLGDA